MVLSLSELRHTILSRQGLIEPFAEPLEAVRAMIAVQTQYAASLPVAVAARTKKAKPGWDEAALQPGGALIKSWSLRHTLHAHTREDHTLVVGSLGPHFYIRHLHFMRRLNPNHAMEDLEPRMMAALELGPLSRKELHEIVPELKSIDYVGWGLDVRGLAFQRRLCVVGRGADQKFCALPEQHVEPNYGDLFRRYLAGYGPATLADFAFWTGLKGPEVRAAFEAANVDVQEVRIEGMKAVRYALKSLRLEERDGKPGVRLLAKFDPLVLSHKDKSLFIAPEYRTRIFRKAGQVEAVVLSEGLAVGTWRLERGTKLAAVTVELFRKLGKREAADLRREAERVAKAVGMSAAEVQFA